MTTDDGDVRDRLTRIEGKLDLLGMQQSTSSAASDRTHSDHEQRLRALERWKYALPITAAGALVTGATAIITAIKGGP
ncbi:hypothetical protein AB0J37_02105 [Microbispora rosea]|uniref:hypothetical protein n=1 Tax=Microbispora rosea TaxID=58117 RepID=UPI0034289352